MKKRNPGNKLSAKEIQKIKKKENKKSKKIVRKQTMNKY